MTVLCLRERGFEGEGTGGRETEHCFLNVPPCLPSLTARLPLQTAGSYTDFSSCAAAGLDDTVTMWKILSDSPAVVVDGQASIANCQCNAGSVKRGTLSGASVVPYALPGSEDHSTPCATFSPALPGGVPCGAVIHWLNLYSVGNPVSCMHEVLKRPDWYAFVSACV